MRLLFFGMRCPFSPPVLAALMDAGHTIGAIVVPGAPGSPPWRWERKPGAGPGLPMAGPPTLNRLAACHAVPLAGSGDLRHHTVLETVGALRPDLIVVACFPRLLPASLTALARYGGVNLHPSLLPAFRGPEPLFWTLRSGLRESGVTAHRLSERFDTGAIYAQRPVTLPFGERLDTIEHRFAQVAGDLAADVIAAIAAGTAMLTPQDDAGATTAPFPTAADFVIPTTWTAEHAFTFARAVAPLGGPLAVALPDGRLMPVLDALDWSKEPLTPDGDQATCDSFPVSFVTGYVSFRIPKM